MMLPWKRPGRGFQTPNSSISFVLHKWWFSPLVSCFVFQASFLFSGFAFWALTGTCCICRCLHFSWVCLAGLLGLSWLEHVWLEPASCPLGVLSCCSPGGQEVCLWVCMCLNCHLSLLFVAAPWHERRGARWLPFATKTCLHSWWQMLAMWSAVTALFALFEAKQRNVELESALQNLKTGDCLHFFVEWHTVKCALVFEEQCRTRTPRWKILCCKETCEWRCLDESDESLLKTKRQSVYTTESSTTEVLCSLMIVMVCHWRASWRSWKKP